MVESAALLVRERGVETTSFADVLAHSGAPRGSIYHHFPGGKAELIEAATRYAGDVIAESLGRALAEDDPVVGLRRFAQSWRSILEESDFRAGCAVLPGAIEGDGNAAIQSAAAAAFQSWEASLARSLERCGIPLARASSLATTVVASVEGAIVLSRASATTKPLDDVMTEMERMIEAALVAAPAAP